MFLRPNYITVSFFSRVPKINCMAYRKTLSGKTDGRGYRETRIRSLHFWAGVCILFDAGLFLREFFGAEIRFGSVFARACALFAMVAAGLVKVLVVDALLDKFSSRLKWVVDFLAFGAFFFFMLRYFFFG